MKSHGPFLFAILCLMLFLSAPMAVKILKGMKPMDIPSELPMSHRLTVNLKTARQLGIPVNPHFLSLAHRVIE